MASSLRAMASNLRSGYWIAKVSMKPRTIHQDLERSAAYNILEELYRHSLGENERHLKQHWGRSPGLEPKENITKHEEIIGTSIGKLFFIFLPSVGLRSMKKMKKDI